MTEDGFAATIVLHDLSWPRQPFDNTGQPTSQAGFLSLGANGPVAPLGPLLPQWYWKFTSQPPIFEGKPGLTQGPLRQPTSCGRLHSGAYDDTTNPVQPSNCAGK